MSFSGLDSEKIKFSIVDEIVDNNGDNIIIEVNFSKEFFNRYLNKFRNNLIINFMDDIAITRREAEVLHCIAQGKNNTEIADCLNVSVHTAKAHVQNILRKLLVDDRTAAVVEAIRRGLIRF